MDVKKMLMEIIVKKDITQKELAKLIKVSPAQVSFYLTAINYPRRRTLARIQKIYEEMKGEENENSVNETRSS